MPAPCRLRLFDRTSWKPGITASSMIYPAQRMMQLSRQQTAAHYGQATPARGRLPDLTPIPASAGLSTPSAGFTPVALAAGLPFFS